VRVKSLQCIEMSGDEEGTKSGARESLEVLCHDGLEVSVWNRAVHALGEWGLAIGLLKLYSIPFRFRF